MATTGAANPGGQISEEYRRMQEKLHENPHYGVASVQYAPVVAKIMQQVGTTELLDYGAGKGRLGETLRPMFNTPLNIHHYDPARPEWAAEPQPCGFVCSIDVLEHIEPDYLDNVLDHLKRLVMKRGFFTVHTGPAIKVLPDGRNAHLIQEPPSWWLPKFMERFDLTVFQKMPQGFWVLVERKPEKPALVEPV
jgi:hypothetical protein